MDVCLNRVRIFFFFAITFLSLFSLTDHIKCKGCKESRRVSKSVN